MNCACPAAFGGTSSGRRPAIFSSPKRATARGYGFAGISVPGPGYANPGAMSAVHAPTPYGNWHPGWSQQGAPQGPYGNVGSVRRGFGDAYNGESDFNKFQADTYSSQNNALQTTGGGHGGGGKFNPAAFLDTLLGVWDRVGPVVFGPKGGQGNDQYQGSSIDSQKKPVPWLLIGGGVIAAVVLFGVGVKVLGRRRRNPRRRR